MCNAKSWFMSDHELDCASCGRGPCPRSFHYPIPSSGRTEDLEKNARAEGLRRGIHEPREIASRFVEPLGKTFVMFGDEVCEAGEAGRIQ